MRSIIFFALIFSLIINNTLSGQGIACFIQDDPSKQQVDLRDGDSFISRTLSETAEVSRVDEHGLLVWSEEFPLLAPESFFSKMLYPKGTGKAKGYLIASQDGSNVFFVEMHVGFFGKTQARVSHFNAKGEIRFFDFQDKNKVMGAALQATFCDNEFFYFLTTDKEIQASKHENIGYILNRFRIEDFRYERFNLDLPVIENNQFPAFWTFLGQKDHEKFMVLKTVDVQNNTLEAKVISFGPDGRLLNNTTIRTQPGEQFLRPSNHVARKNRNIVIHSNNDYYNQLAIKASNGIVDYRVGAFFDVMLDEKSGALYISGLMGKSIFGKNPLKYQNQPYHGFYVQKFDAMGKSIWNYAYSGDGKSLSEHDFVKRFPPAYKNSQLVHYPEAGLFNYTIQVKDNLFNFAINEQGQFLGLRKKEFYEQETDNTAFFPQEELERFSFVDEREENSAYVVSDMAPEEWQGSPKEVFSKQKGLLVY